MFRVQRLIRVPKKAAAIRFVLALHFPTMSFLRLAARPAVLSRSLLSARYAQRQLPVARWYSAGGTLTKDAIESRVLNVLKGFEKVNPNSVRLQL